MSDKIIELRKLIDGMSDEGIAKSSITIGKRAQEYGQDNHIIASRKRFSFSVDSNRLADVSFSARSRPDLEGFIRSRVGIWYWSDPAARNYPKYQGTIQDKIKKASDHGLVDYFEYEHGKKSIIPGASKHILQEIGRYDRAVFEGMSPEMSRKIESAFGSYMTDLIFSDYPDIDEALAAVRGFSMQCPRLYGGYQDITGIDILSQLESLSVIRRVGDKFIPFYAYEIFGSDVEKLFEENVFDSHLDVVRNMIMKMPGLSRATLMKRLPKEANKKVIESALEAMWRNKLIYVTKTQDTLLGSQDSPEAIIIPTWFVHFIMDSRPQLVQTEAFNLTMISLSWFWESMVQPLEEFDEEIDKFNQFISSICRNATSWREIYGFGTPITNLAHTMSKTGLLLDQTGTDETYCLEQSKKVLSAIQEALAHSYDSEIWFGGLSRPTSSEQVIAEVDSASNVINQKILSKWKPAELTRITDFGT